MKLIKNGGLIAIALMLMPLCASATWREGFKNSKTLHLIGEGKASGDVPQIQAEAMARESAVIDAMSHWPKYCGDADATEFRIENQKERAYQCDGSVCRARIVIEKTDLRKKCNR